MLFEASYHSFGGIRLVISLYMIFIFVIKSFCCADEIASKQSPSIYHNPTASHANLRRNNRLSVLPQTIDPANLYRLLTVVTGVIALSLMVVRCMRFLKYEVKSIQKSLPGSESDNDGVAEYEVGGTGIDTDDEKTLPVPEVSLSSGKHTLPEDEESLPDANEIGVASAHGFYGAVALCQFLGLENVSNLSYLDELIKEESRRWQEPWILIGTSVANNEELEGSFSPKEIELLRKRRYRDLQQLSEILDVGSPIPLMTASNLLNLAKEFMESKHRISLPELGNVLKSLKGTQLIDIQNLDSLKSLKDVLPGGIHDPRNQQEKVFIERVQEILQPLIRLNNLLVHFQDHVDFSMRKFSISDKELLIMIRNEGEATL